jgi:hypothetical protein
MPGVCEGVRHLPFCGRRDPHFLAREHNPELAGIRIVRSRADLTPAMPAFVTAFLAQILPR